MVFESTRAAWFLFPAASVAAAAAGLPPVSSAFWVFLALLGTANAFWLAGGLILRGAMNREYDRPRGLGFLPARVGEKRALDIAAVLHAASVLALAGAGCLGSAPGPVYGIGVLLVSALVGAAHIKH